MEITSENPLGSIFEKLGKGERSVLSYVQSNPNSSIAVIDDKKARRVAIENGINLTGLLGLTTRGFEICVIQKQSDLLIHCDEWKINQFRIPPRKKLNEYVKELTKD